MSVLLILGAGMVAWLLVGVVIGLVLGRVLRLRERQVASQAGKEQAAQEVPSDRPV